MQKTLKRIAFEDYSRKLTSFIHEKIYEVGRINVSIDDRFELVENRDKDRFEVNRLKKK